MYIGYSRVSTTAQNTNRQTDALFQAGCGKVFIDKISGATAQRPELERMFDQFRPGDVVVVTELSRFGRNTKDLITLIEKLRLLNVGFKSLKETFIDTTTPSGNLIFLIFAAVAEFERELIIERTKEGLNAARARGRKGGRPKANPNAVTAALILHQNKTLPISEIIKQTGISKSTLYNYMKAHKNQKADTED